MYQGPNNTIVREEAQTFSVSAYGAGIILTHAPQVEQALVLIHGRTKEEVFCRVANTTPIPKSTSYEVGVDFRESRPKFWHIVFPDPSWDPNERKRCSKSLSTAA